MEPSFGVFHHIASENFYLIPDNVDLSKGRYSIVDLKDHPILVRKKDVEQYEKSREEVMEYLQESTEAHIRASREGISRLYNFTKKFGPEEQSEAHGTEQRKSMESLVYSVLGVSKESILKNEAAAKSGMENIQKGFEDFMQKAQLEFDESESAKELMEILNKTFDSFEEKVQKGLDKFSEKIERFLNDEKTETAFKDWTTKWTNEYTDEQRKEEIKNKLEHFANQFLNTGKGSDAPTDKQ